MTEENYDMSLGWNSLAAEMLYAYMPGGVKDEELAFYERRIRANGGPALDQACGTGRHLFPLLERGLQVHGADISADALDLAGKEAEVRNVSPELYRLFRQSMEECDLPYSYGTIYVANCTFQIICDRRLALATLRRFREHLEPGGQLLLELSVPPQATQVPESNDSRPPVRWGPKKRRGGEGEIVTTLWAEKVDLFRQTMLSKRRCDLIVDGKIVKSEEHSHYMCWYCHYEALMLLELAGYDDLTTYGDFGDSPATKDSKTVVYAGRRPL